MSSVLAIVEQHDGSVGRISWEALAAAHALGGNLDLPVNAAVIGSETEAAAAAISARAPAEFSASNTPCSHPIQRTATSSRSSSLSQKKAPHTWSSRTPTRCATTPLHWPHASARCSSATSSPSPTARSSRASSARPFDRRLSSHRRRPLLCLRAGRRLPCCGTPCREPLHQFNHLHARPRRRADSHPSRRALPRLRPDR